MGKITFYCTICAGPLHEWELRKRSMLQPDEDVELCFDDDCDCDYDEDEDKGEEGEENSEADLLKHDEYCNYRRGYWGDILSERDIKWLSDARMLGYIGPCNGVPLGALFQWGLTESGSYDPYDGLILPGSDSGLWPNQDGYLVHHTCWQILTLVHRSQHQRPIHPHDVYLTMQSKLTHQNDIYLDWGDDRLYGGTEEFAEQEWLPVPGYEWLVTDPMKKIDFSELVMESTKVGADPGSLNGHAASTVSADDPFGRLPTEIQHMILELLPSRSVVNLFLSSRAFRGAPNTLPRAFWRSRIYTDTPWILGTSLHGTISGESRRVNYKSLLRLLKHASARPVDGKNARFEAHLSLKNRRRIWACCEGIVDIVDLWWNHQPIRKI
ncbi:hypothetical protein BDW59DRAFT_136822 [Aspergillus cavernicola]|uniref:F-box domain-containing protein n=1 Tax=Aspergillus cavernicola TaxID=176166 RepID=A0ABR4J4F9_9EURO